jgi:hypothetical protein
MGFILMTLQSQLFVSPRYELNINYLVDICHMKTDDAQIFIADNIPHLLDPNYIGHDKDGKPCKSITKDL